MSGFSPSPAAPAPLTQVTGDDPADRDRGPLWVGAAVGLVAESADPELDHLADDLRVWFGNWAAAGFFRAVEVP